MKIKLINNPQLEQPTMSDKIKSACESLIVTGCTSMSAKQMFDEIIQKQIANGNVICKRIRIDLPWDEDSGKNMFVGTYEDLNNFAKLEIKGYDSALNPCERFSLIGIWVITDYVTNVLIDRINSMFQTSELTIETPYVIDLDTVEAQTIEPNHPSYNPGMAVYLDSKGFPSDIGRDKLQLFDGKYVLYKGQKNAIFSALGLATGGTDSAFYDLSSGIADTNMIVSDDPTIEYQLSSLNLRDCSNRTIGVSAFYKCKTIKEVVLPSALTALPAYCFGSSSLESLSGFENIRSFGKGCFTSSKLGEVPKFNDNITQFSRDTLNAQPNFRVASKRLPAKLQSSIQLAFSGCSSLDISAWPSTLTKIPIQMFWNCNMSSMTETPNCPVGGNNCFTNCKFSHLTIHGVSGCESQTYLSCTRLSSVIMEEGITKIGYQAFQGCTALEHIELPDSLLSVEGAAFKWTNLSSVTFGPNFKQFISTSNYGWPWANNPTQTNMLWCRLKGTDVIPTGDPGFNKSKLSKIYVGNGVDKAEDDAILATYLTKTPWSTTYASYMDTWYNHEHPVS